MNLVEVKFHAEEASALLKSMANESRLAVLCELSRGEMSVAELLRAVPLRPSALSQHLARLRGDRLVEARRSSQAALYSLASEEARAIIVALHRLYCGAGQGARNETSAGDLLNSQDSARANRAEETSDG